MSNNPEIEQILDNAIKLAKGYRHKYVTVEHLSLALIRFEPFTAVSYTHLTLPTTCTV